MWRRKIKDGMAKWRIAINFGWMTSRVLTNSSSEKKTLNQRARWRARDNKANVALAPRARTCSASYAALSALNLE